MTTPLVPIIMGSKSDLAHGEKIACPRRSYASGSAAAVRSSRTPSRARSTAFCGAPAAAPSSARASSRRRPPPAGVSVM